MRPKPFSLFGKKARVWRGAPRSCSCRYRNTATVRPAGMRERPENKYSHLPPPTLGFPVSASDWQNPTRRQRARDTGGWSLHRVASQGSWQEKRVTLGSSWRVTNAIPIELSSPFSHACLRLGSRGRQNSKHPMNRMLQKRRPLPQDLAD